MDFDDDWTGAEAESVRMERNGAADCCRGCIDDGSEETTQGCDICLRKFN